MSDSPTTAFGENSFDALFEPHRQALQLHCYRMMGSIEDAEDLVQETLLRAWRRYDSFEGRSSLRTWLYQIATNTCLDALRKRKRRLLPIASHPESDPEQPFSPPDPASSWLEPYPGHWISADTAVPEARYSLQESVRLAFIMALQVLPPRQRAVLILRDVLDLRAKEVAPLLDMTVSAVNSALNRARATMKQQQIAERQPRLPDDEDALLRRYVRAWEQADVVSLVSVLRDDAIFTMPPSTSWYRGPANIATFLEKQILLPMQPPLWRLVPTNANRQPAFGLYQWHVTEGRYVDFALHTVEIVDGQIQNMVVFIRPDLFERFGLPPVLET